MPLPRAARTKPKRMLPAASPVCGGRQLSQGVIPTRATSPHYMDGHGLGRCRCTASLKQRVPGVSPSGSRHGRKTHPCGCSIQAPWPRTSRWFWSLGGRATEAGAGRKHGWGSLSCCDPRATAAHTVAAWIESTSYPPSPASPAHRAVGRLQRLPRWRACCRRILAPEHVRENECGSMRV